MIRLAFVLLLVAVPLCAQDSSRPRVRAAQLTGEFRLDGLLADVDCHPHDRALIR